MQIDSEYELMKIKSTLNKERFKTFAERNFVRLRRMYPFLPEQQLKSKVKSMWAKTHGKCRGTKCRSETKTSKQVEKTSKEIKNSTTGLLAAYAKNWFDFMSLIYL